MRATITDSADPNAYPISLFTWILVYKDQQYGNRTKEEAMELLDLLLYMLSPPGQKVAAQINYAPLPKQGLEKNYRLLQGLHYGGEPLFDGLTEEKLENRTEDGADGG